MMIVVRNLSHLITNSNIFLNLTRFKYSYAFTPSSIDYYSPKSIGQLIEQRAIDSPEVTACVSMHQNISKTYKQLNYEANKLARGLLSIGCVKGCRVGIWSPNCYEWVVTQYAAAKIGAILVNVNPGYQAGELEYCLNFAGCHTLISCQKFKTTNYGKILETIEPNILKQTNGLGIKSQIIPTLKNILMIDEFDCRDSDKQHDLILFNDFMDKFDGQTNIESSVEFDESINIQFTSGTTGRSKGATLTHNNIIQNAFFFGQRLFESLDNKTICVPPPLYHCFGSVLGTILSAVNSGTVILPSPTHNPMETLKAVEKYRCGVIYGTPTMFLDLVYSDYSKFDTSSLNRGLIGGATVSKFLCQSISRAFPSCKHILIIYGTTECSPIITSTSIHDSGEHSIETVGQPLGNIEAKIVDTKTGQIQPIGVSGEVCSRGNNTFAGYWNQDDKTAEVLDKNKWYHTGDIGVMDEQGYISIKGRLKEMIIRGGENIYPREIEEFLLKHEKIFDVQIVGIPDERFGEELVGFVITRSGAQLDAEDLKGYCKGKISHFKIPKYFQFVKDFPRTVTGKIEKYKLKKLAEDIYVN